MLFDDPESGVVIADQRSGLRLRRLGEANELGYPTLIEVRAGPFSGCIRDDTVTSIQRFVKTDPETSLRDALRDSRIDQLTKGFVCA